MLDAVRGEMVLHSEKESDFRSGKQGIWVAIFHVLPYWQAMSMAIHTQTATESRCVIRRCYLLGQHPQSPLNACWGMRLCRVVQL